MYHQVRELLVTVLTSSCLLFVSSCHLDSDVESNTKKAGNIQIKMYSPYSYYNEIDIDSIDHITSVLAAGTEHGTYKIISKRIFTINSDSDNVKISNIVSKIELRSEVKSTHTWDAYHFIFVKDNRKLIDVYGQDTLLNKIFVILQPYVKDEKNGEGDFFNLFRARVNF